MSQTIIGPESIKTLHGYVDRLEGGTAVIILGIDKTGQGIFLNAGAVEDLSYLKEVLEVTLHKKLTDTLQRKPAEEVINDAP